MRTHLISLALSALLLSACDPLSFGTDAEISGSEFDQTKLDLITQLTGIVFPPGSKGLHYYYYGSGIDDALEAKIEISPNSIQQFLANPLFAETQENSISSGIPNERTWWKPNLLIEPISSTKDTPGTGGHGVTFGKEGDSHIAYVYWYTT